MATPVVAHRELLVSRDVLLAARGLVGPSEGHACEVKCRECPGCRGETGCTEPCGTCTPCHMRTTWESLNAVLSPSSAKSPSERLERERCRLGQLEPGDKVMPQDVRGIVFVFEYIDALLRRLAILEAGAAVDTLAHAAAARLPQ